VYSSQLLDHFEHPRNAGTLEDATAVVQVENPVCGDVLKLSARTTDGKIAEIRFLAKGCVPAMACGSAITELTLGKNLALAGGISEDEVTRFLDGLPQASAHAAQLAIAALRALIQKIKLSQSE
jgi:NifU-like protein involved in Fe-S cluster formation